MTRRPMMCCAVAALLGACSGALAAPKADAVLRDARSRYDAAVSWLDRKRAALAEEMAEARVNLGRVPEALDAAGAKLERAREEIASLTRAPESPDPARLRTASRDEILGVVWRDQTAVSADEPWPRRLVLLVHGLDEPGGVWADLAPALLDENLPVARFDYSNDQPIARSADELASALRSLRASGVERVDLVCHSMGGLVARDVLTRPSYYHGVCACDARDAALPSVGRLVLLGTPNLGSPFASLQCVTEAREHFVRWMESGGLDAAAATAFLRDGRGEASRDLAVGSDFLNELNERPLPTGVKITVIAGRVGDGEVEAAARLLDSCVARELLDAELLARLRASSEALQKKVGDGVVPLESACLEGVDDVVVLDADHRGLVSRTVPRRGRAEPMKGEPRACAIDEIVKRLVEK